MCYGVFNTEQRLHIGDLRLPVDIPFILGGRVPLTQELMPLLSAGCNVLTVGGVAVPSVKTYLLIYVRNIFLSEVHNAALKAVYLPQYCYNQCSSCCRYTVVVWPCERRYSLC